NLGRFGLWSDGCGYGLLFFLQRADSQTAGGRAVSEWGLADALARSWIWFPGRLTSFCVNLLCEICNTSSSVCRICWCSNKSDCGISCNSFCGIVRCRNCCSRGVWSSVGDIHPCVEVPIVLEDRGTGF